MSEIFSWAETPAGLLANGGYHPEDRAAELAEREAEWRLARTEFDAKVAADPAWAASRKLQQALAERGNPGTWINVGPSRPPELEPLFTARTAAQARAGTWGPASNGGMEPTNDVAEQIEEHSRQRYEAARLRRQMENQHLPPGAEAL